MSGTIKVFISHTTRDRDLCSRLVDLLQKSLRLRDDEIRCTSLQGYQLGVGEPISERLREEIQAKLFIGVITPEVFRSTYAVLEMGARWGTANPLWLILARGMVVTKLPKPLDELNALPLATVDDVYKLVEDAHSLLGGDIAKPTSYSASARQLLTAASPVQVKHRFDYVDNDFVLARALVVFQAETMEGKHSAKEKDPEASNGWCRYANITGSERGHVLFGPYEAITEPGPYVAVYRVKVSDRAPDGPLFEFEVRNGGRADRSIHRESFTTPGTYDTLAVPFEAETTSPMEYRIRPSRPIGQIWIDYVAVLPG